MGTAQLRLKRQGAGGGREGWEVQSSGEDAVRSGVGKGGQWETVWEDRGSLGFGLSPGCEGCVCPQDSELASLVESLSTSRFAGFVPVVCPGV